MGFIFSFNISNPADIFLNIFPTQYLKASSKYIFPPTARHISGINSDI